MTDEKEARYWSDKATLDKQARDGLCTEKDLELLNVLPENYLRWKEEYDKKKHIEKINECLESWVKHWNNGRIQCLQEIKEVSQEYGYSQADLKQFVIDKLKERAKLQEKQEEVDKEYEQNISDSDIKSDYLDLIKDKKWGDASELLVEWIKEQIKIYTTKDDEKSEIWIYKDGIYVPEGKSHIKEMLRELLEKWYSTYVFNLVIAKIEPDTFIESKEFFNTNNKYEIPLSNGIFNIQTKQLSPFTPNKIFFNKLPVEYNLDADCPNIDKFLGEVLAKEEDKKVFYEIGGFCLLKEYLFEKAFMFVGDGRNGKDKSLELIKRLIGIQNCCSVPLSSIVLDSFIISEFFGKMVNLAGDISNKDLKETSGFKALTGRSLISAPRKFLNPITFQNYAKFIFACNELPLVYDNSLGFWDRWVLLEFPYTFVPQQELYDNPDNNKLKLRNENIIEEITSPEEMSGLLNRFLAGLDRLLTQKAFSSTKGTKEIKEFWIRKSNSFMAFCMDFIEGDYNSYITKKDLRKKYNNYCKEHEIPNKSDFVIKRTLEELYGSIEALKNVVLNMQERVWEGIKFKEK